MKLRLAKIKVSVLVFILFALLLPAQTLALSAAQKQVFDEGIYTFNTDDYSQCSYSGGSGGSGSSSQNAKTVFDFLLGKGLQAPQVAAIMGNLEVESGFDPTAYYPGGHTDNPDPSNAFGLVQWKGGHQTNLRSLADSRNLPITDLGVQMDFMWSELSGGYKDSVLTPIQQASDLFNMTDIVNNSYEVSGSPTQPRFDDAQALLNQYGSDAPSGDSSGGTSSGCGGTSYGASATDCNVTSPVYGSVGGSGNEYSQAQLTQLFGNPGTADSHPDMDANLVTVSFLGFSTKVNKLVAPCLMAVAQEIQASGSTYKITQFGCYRFDSDNGTSNIGLKSYHTYGAACDINWNTNPFVESGADTTHDMPAEYITAFHDHGFTWGGAWQKPKDYMHFEFNGLTPP